MGMKTVKELGAPTQGIYSIVDEGIEAHYERAVAAGAEIVMELHDTDYGSREYMVRDRGKPLELRHLPPVRSEPG